MYKNDEMYNLMQALNVEDNTEGLRYEKVLLATDAGRGRMHIRNLIDHVFLPLLRALVTTATSVTCWRRALRVRNKEKTIYCYSEAGARQSGDRTGRQTRDHALQGLGEISPKEFAQFIGKEMRLSKVEYAPKPEAVPILNFYMGKNTPSGKTTSWRNWWCGGGGNG